MTKHIGIQASSSEGEGLGYLTICLEASIYIGEHNHLGITMCSIPLAEHIKFIKVDDWNGLAKSKAYSVNKLADTGAYFVIYPDNTNRLAFNQLPKFTDIPFINIAEAVIIEA